MELRARGWSVRAAPREVRRRDPHPERQQDVIAERQHKTLKRFFAQHGHRPVGAERGELALFLTSHRNHDGSVDRPVAAQHTGRGWFLYFPAGCRRWGMSME